MDPAVATTRPGRGSCSTRPARSSSTTRTRPAQPARSSSPEVAESLPAARPTARPTRTRSGRASASRRPPNSPSPRRRSRPRSSARSIRGSAARSAHYLDDIVGAARTWPARPATSGHRRQRRAAGDAAGHAGGRFPDRIATAGVLRGPAGHADRPQGGRVIPRPGRTTCRPTRRARGSCSCAIRTTTAAARTISRGSSWRSGSICRHVQSARSRPARADYAGGSWTPPHARLPPRRRRLEAATGPGARRPSTESSSTSWTRSAQLDFFDLNTHRTLFSDAGCARRSTMRSTVAPWRGIGEWIATAARRTRPTSTSRRACPDTATRRLPPEPDVAKARALAQAARARRQCSTPATATHAPSRRRSSRPTSGRSASRSRSRSSRPDPVHPEGRPASRSISG